MNIPNNKIVDIRLPSEWMEFGVLEGSKLITYEMASGKVNPMFVPLISQNFSHDEKFVLMCETGSRSKDAVKLLKENGFSEVCDVTGGAYYYEKIGAKFTPYKG